MNTNKPMNWVILILTSIINFLSAYFLLAKLKEMFTMPLTLDNTIMHVILLIFLLIIIIALSYAAYTTFKSNSNEQ